MQNCRVSHLAIFTFWLNDAPPGAEGVNSLSAVVCHQLREFIARAFCLLGIRLHPQMR
jgi:hypothetical protein